MRVVLLIILIFLFFGCSKNKCQSSKSLEPVDIQLDRLDQKIFNSNSVEEVKAIFKANPFFSNHFLHSDQYPPDSLENRFFNLLKNKSIDTLYNESLESFSNIDEIIENLEQSFAILKSYFPETKIPTIQTVVTGLYNDLFVSNEYIIIGMDFFIGQNATYKPQQIPLYIQKRYTTQHLPANIMQFVSGQYVKATKGKTMLASMIDYGKSYYLLQSILPCTAGNILMGYTEEEWNDSFENEAIIWANFVENNLLYETNFQIKQKFLGERPNIYEIGDKCPGRIGRWVGWQIVNAYMENTDTSIQELMNETDVNKIFRLSEYKPMG